MLLFGVLPAWGLPGLADWACHRRSRIEDPEHGGVRESLTHVLMFAEGAVPMGLVLLAEVNTLVVALLSVSALVHEATARWDLQIATDSDRVVSPLEQQVHTALETIPFLVAMLAALQQAEVPTSSNPWKLRRKATPLPVGYVAGILLGTGITGALPHLEELWRCARKAKQQGEDYGITRPVATE
jgi:hypothetical protein